METDGETVVREVILGLCDGEVLFMKQMAHHLVDLDRKFLDRTANVLLIRDPAEVLKSLVHQLPQPTLADTGISIQRDLLEQLRARGQDPPVIDSRELLLDPRSVLERLCALLEIEFEEAMLSWKPGPRPEDGVWAPHWYKNVHRSTGFRPYRLKAMPFPEHLEPLLEECRPHYEELFASALRAEL
jgi:hypothetical protein